jgi:hypothetical protein
MSSQRLDATPNEATPQHFSQNSAKELLPLYVSFSKIAKALLTDDLLEFAAPKMVGFSQWTGSVKSARLEDY